MEDAKAVRTVYVNDTNYGPDQIRDHRKSIIELRDHALQQNNFEWSIVLSVTVALLACFAEELEK